MQMITALKHMLSNPDDSKPVAYIETIIDYENDIITSDKDVFMSGVRAT